MPFFSGRPRDPSPARNPAPQPVPTQEPAAHNRKSNGGGLFHRRRSPSPSLETRNPTGTTQPASSLSSSSSDHPRRKGTLLSKFGGGGGRNESDLDPSILAARERVMAAEAAEQDADRSLAAARQSVAAAREEVRRLEAEAKEDARRAKVKSFHAKEISKQGKALGRECSFLFRTFLFYSFSFFFLLFSFGPFFFLSLHSHLLWNLVTDKTMDVRFWMSGLASISLMCEFELLLISCLISTCFRDRQPVFVFRLSRFLSLLFQLSQPAVMPPQCINKQTRGVRENTAQTQKTK